MLLLAGSCWQAAAAAASAATLVFTATSAVDCCSPCSDDPLLTAADLFLEEASSKLGLSLQATKAMREKKKCNMIAIAFFGGYPACFPARSTTPKASFFLKDAQFLDLIEQRSF